MFFLIVQEICFPFAFSSSEKKTPVSSVEPEVEEMKDDHVTPGSPVTPGVPVTPQEAEEGQKVTNVASTLKGEV